VCPLGADGGATAHDAGREDVGAEAASVDHRPQQGGAGQALEVRARFAQPSADSDLERLAAECVEVDAIPDRLAARGFLREPPPSPPQVERGGWQGEALASWLSAPYGRTVVTRLLIGAVSAFLVFWAVLWWVQGREGLSVTTEDDLADERVSTRELGETAVLLSRYGLSAFVGSLGILIGCIAVLGPGRAEWAQRGTWAMICLALAAVAAMGVAWTWGGFRAERLPAQEDPGYVDRAISEGPSEALAGLFWGLVPVRLTLFVGTVGFGALAVFLVYWAVMLIAGEASLEAPKSAGTVGSVVEIFELVALVLFLALLLIGTVAGLVTGDADLIGACLVVLALYAVALGIGYLLGWLDGMLDAAEKVLDFFGG
jgi:hypothetical protein